jgi:hypothetical protein
MGRDYPATLALALELRFDPMRLSRPTSRTAVRILPMVTHAARQCSVFGVYLGRGGWAGIRTPGAGKGTHAFQACTIDRSVTHPESR